MEHESPESPEEQPEQPGQPGQPGHSVAGPPREHDFAILERVEGELADVERALSRLDDGSYGTCEACGGAITDDRLEAMPAARFCAEHQPTAEPG